MTSATAVEPGRTPSDLLRQAELALRRLGFAKITPARRGPAHGPAFWVQEPGVPRRTFPVFVESPGAAGSPWDRWIRSPGQGSKSPTAIVVVPTDGDAEIAWTRARPVSVAPINAELSILVLPESKDAESEAHWHTAVIERRELLRLATGIVVGLFRRGQAAEGNAQIDFDELLEILRGRFRIDVQRSLGVGSDEDALFVLYQLAARDSYAPGDPASNLHMLVLRPTGPAARAPWFAA